MNVRGFDFVESPTLEEVDALDGSKFPVACALVLGLASGPPACTSEDDTSDFATDGSWIALKSFPYRLRHMLVHTTRIPPRSGKSSSTIGILILYSSGVALWADDWGHSARRRAMMRHERSCAGPCNSTGTGRLTVPYETAMERMPERAPERAAPIVPEERANAAK